MKLKQLSHALIVFILLTPYSYAAFAQQAKHGYYKPDAILVQLRSEQARIKYMMSVNKKKAAQLSFEAGKIRQVMMNDFNDHFNYCPVYFFIDTNQDKIKNRHFNNVLFNKDGAPASYIATQNYYIAYYGYPQIDESNAGAANSDLTGKGIVMLKQNFEPTHKPFPCFIWTTGFTDLFTKKDDRYAYRSKHYNMGYFPLAGELNEELNFFFRVKTDSLTHIPDSK